MNQTQLCFLKTIKYFLENQKFDSTVNVDGVSCEEVLQLSHNHNVLPMAYEVIYDCEMFGQLAPHVQMIYKYKSNVMQQVVMQMKRTDDFLKFYQFLLEHDVKPMVVKGIICRNIYAKPDHRISNDEDLFVPREMMQKCHKCFIEYGFQTDWDGQGEIPDEVPYVLSEKGIMIELHNSLFPRDSKAYGEYNELFAHSYDEKVVETIQGITVYTMKPDDHFLYLVCHALKHFLHSGFGIRQVCDILIYGKKYEHELNWSEIYQKLRKIYADTFLAAIFDIGKKYFDIVMENTECSQIFDRIDVDCEDMLVDLLEGGVFGDSSMTRKHSSTITLNAVSAAKENQKHSMLGTIFPSKEYLESRYTYLRKHPMLLPIAWVSRLLTYRKQIKERREDNPYESMELGRQRIELLKEYKIIS